MPDDTTQPTGDTAQSAAPKTFTQAELDQIIKDRLGRERDSAKTQLAELESYKARAAKLDELEKANMSEADKIRAALADRDTRLAELEAKAKASDERATTLVRQTKAVSAASMLGAYDPSDPNFTAAVAGIDPASPTADVDIKAALDALKTAKPYLFKPPGARPLESFNPGAGTGTAETDAQRAARVLRSSQGAGKGYGPLG